MKNKIKIILLILAVFVITFTLFMYFSNQYIKNVQAVSCANNMRTVIPAIKQYKAKTGNWPETIAELYPVYIADRRKLGCPIHPSDTAELISSYTYIKPTNDTTPDTYIILTEKDSSHLSPAGHINNE